MNLNKLIGAIVSGFCLQKLLKPSLCKYSFCYFQKSKNINLNQQLNFKYEMHGRENLRGGLRFFLKTLAN